MVKPIIDDELGAFCAHQPPVCIAGAERGDLARLTFAAKDLFAIKGQVSGAGNPDWLRTHEPETCNATVIDSLLQAGACLVGKTHTDELAFSLNGENHHYGTPMNPAAPDCIPGGSSSGSASAVAGKLVDFALGTDTGGSVRVPASYCGLFGIRTTHGRVDKSGLVPLCPSFDCIGWFTRSANLLHRVGKVILGSDSNPQPPKKLLILQDMMEQVDSAHADLLMCETESLARQSGLALEITQTTGDNLQDWFEAFRLIQITGAWHVHKHWIETVRPTFGPGVQERFNLAANSHLEAHRLPAAKALCNKVKERVETLCENGGVLVLPSSAGPAPLRNGKRDQNSKAANAFRERTVRLTCLSGLSGNPQVTAPLASLQGKPIGLSFLGAANSDLGLLHWLDSNI